mgnify:CR=1 FL=1
MKRRLCPFGKAVKKALLDKNMTQEELAKHVGTSPAYLGLILFGNRTGMKYRHSIVTELGLDSQWENIHKTNEQGMK